LNLEAALVRVRPDGASDDQEQRANTDRAGRVTFAGIPTGECWVWVTHDEFAEGWTHTVVRAEETARVGVRLQRLIPVHGRVVDDRSGDPVAGARVLLEAGGMGGGRTSIVLGSPPLGSTTTDGGGRFQIGAEPGSLLTLRATAEGYAEASESLIRTKPGDEVVLRLLPGGALRGIVLGPDGAPCRDAKVFVVPSEKKEMLQNPRTVMGPEGPVFWTTGEGEEGEIGSGFDREVQTVRARRTATDRSGRFEVAHLPLPCDVHVLAEGPDGFRGGTGPVVLDEQHRTSDAEVILEPRRAIVVHVVGPGGDPRPGVRVGVEGVNRTGVGVSFLAPRGDYTWWNDEPVLPQGSTSRFPHLAPGLYTVVVEGDPDAPAGRRVELTPDADAEVTVQVEAAQTIEGVVVDAEGKAISAAQIRWRGVPQVADETGRFRIEVGAHEDATLEVWSPWHLPETLNVLEPTKQLRVVLQRRPVISGKLVRYEGADTLRNHIWVAEEPSPGLMQGATVDEDGRFRYPLGRANEEVWIMLLPPGAADVLLGPFVLAPNEQHDVGLVQLDPGRVVEGRTTDKQGLPIEGARVLVYRPGRREMRFFGMGRNPEATTAGDGTFRIEQVHRGEATVLATHPNYAPAQSADSGSGRLTLVMHPPSFLDGRLVGKGGEPLGRVRVVVDGGMLDAIPEVAYGQTDEGGRFRLGPFPAGTYRVRALREGNWQDVGEVRLVEGETTQADWTVP
jgi:hypothetical protein